MFCTKCGSKIADGSKFCNVCGNDMRIQPTPPVNQAAQFGNISPTEPVGQVPQFGNISPTEPVGQVPQFGNVYPTAPMNQVPQFGNISPTAPVNQPPQFENISPTAPAEPFVNNSNGFQNQTGTVDIPLGNYPQSNNVTGNMKEKSSGNKGIIIGLILTIVVLAVVVVLLLVKPFDKSDKEEKSEASTQITTTEAYDPNTTAAPATEEDTEEATESPTLNTDNGGSFMLVNGILSVDNSLFGKNYEELNEYFSYGLPSLTYWEWSEVPLDYLDYYYSDGNKYTLYFENNILVGVRYEAKIYDYMIPDELYDAAIDRFGDYEQYWYNEDTLQEFEYDWNVKINAKNGQYAVFLNSYDENDYVVQQYTSGDYSGEYIQNH